MALADLRAGDDFDDSVASALGFGSAVGAIAGLRGATALVVVDSCEHVLDNAARFIDDLLDEAVDVRLLATSRTPLEVQGERVVPVAPLPSDDGIDLLRDRAVAAGARLDPSSDEDLAELVARVDGLPLAIELAAIRLRSLEPAAITAVLDGRSDLLQAARPVADRHESLERAIAWSTDLLEDRSREVFAALSIFETPFDLDAAHAVAAADGESTLDTADALDRLCSQSLLSPDADGGSRRYRYLETIRDAARNELEASGRHDEVLERYLDYLHQLASATVTRGMSDWSEAMISEVIAMAPTFLGDVLIGHHHDAVVVQRGANRPQYLNRR